MSCSELHSGARGGCGGRGLGHTRKSWLASLPSVRPSRRLQDRPVHRTFASTDVRGWFFILFSSFSSQQTTMSHIGYWAVGGSHRP